MQTLPARRANSREAILDAAEAIVSEAGAVHLTLDAVAERAGISKGGLLYNYNSKEALLQAMIARHLEHVARQEQDMAGTLPPGPANELKAVLLSALRCKESARDRRVGASMVAAGANDPKLLDPIRELHRRRVAQFQASAAAGGPGFDRAALVFLAADGLLLTELLQVSPYDAEQRQRLIDGMIRMLDEQSDPVHARAGCAV